MERIVLDPVEVASSRVELDLSRLVGKDGVDWGDAKVEQYLADAALGQLPVDHRVPNREIQIPLVLKDLPGLTFAEGRAAVQKKAAKFQDEGGWIKRVLDGGERNFYADVVGATLKLSGGWLQAHRSLDVDAVLTLEAIPDFYGDEIDLGLVTETTEPELIHVFTDIEGDYPARVRIVVEEQESQDWLGLIGGFRSRHYSADATAALAYDATDLEPLDAAAVDGDAVEHADLGSNWTPVLGTDYLGDPLTHTGSYRVFATIESDDGSDVRLRFVYDVGDLILPEENAPVAIPGATNLYMVDLGELRLDPAPVGTHRWRGQVQAQGATGGEQVRIKRLRFQPLDESAWRITAAINAGQGLADYVARDEFDQSAGNLNGKTLPVGGTWATSGVTTDFFVDTAHTAQRTTISDASAAGRVALAGAGTPTAVCCQVDVKYGGSPALDFLGLGLIARYVDSSNYLVTFLGPRTSSFGSYVELDKKVAGVDTLVGRLDPFSFVNVNAWLTVRLLVTASGYVFVWVFPKGGMPGAPVISAYDAALAPGGSLASGKVGFFDAFTGTGAVPRQYDNFAAWVPDADAVLFADQSAELRTDGMFRATADGAGSGTTSPPIGDYPRIPPSGLEGRLVELLLKQSGGDFDRVPDTDGDLAAHVLYRPSWLFPTG